MAEARFGDLVKAVVDIARGVMVLDAEDTDTSSTCVPVRESVATPSRTPTLAVR